MLANKQALPYAGAEVLAHGATFMKIYQLRYSFGRDLN